MEEDFDYNDFDYNDRCAFCRKDITHSRQEHDTRVANAIRVENEREDALLRQAKRQYDRP